MENLTAMTLRQLTDWGQLSGFASEVRKFNYGDTAFAVDGVGDGFLIHFDLEMRTPMAKPSDPDRDPVEVENLFLPVTVVFQPEHTRPATVSTVVVKDELARRTSRRPASASLTSASEPDIEDQHA